MPGKKVGRPPPIQRARRVGADDGRAPYDAGRYDEAQYDDRFYEAYHQPDRLGETPTLALAGLSNEGSGEPPSEENAASKYLRPVEDFYGGEGRPSEEDGAAKYLRPLEDHYGGEGRPSEEEDGASKYLRPLEELYPPSREGQGPVEWAMMESDEEDEEDEDDEEEFQAFGHHAPERGVQAHEGDGPGLDPGTLVPEIGEAIVALVGHGTYDWDEFKMVVRRRVRERAEAEGVFGPQTFDLMQSMPSDVLRWGCQRKAFWRPRGSYELHSAHFGVQHLAGMAVKRFVDVGETPVEDLMRLIGNPEAEGIPVTGREVFDFMVQQGQVTVDGNVATVTSGGVGAVARMAAAEAHDPGRFEEGEHAADRGQQGYATVAMTIAHSAMDRAPGSTVKYHRSEAERAPTVLKLVGGEFRWVADDKAASGPDLSQKTGPEVWASSPAFATMRSRELVGQGMTGREANLQAIQEIRSNPRVIFVMDSAGDFYAANAKLHEIHHSTLLAGKAVAAAGELALNDGQCTMISDQSGHYMPGPGYTWQAVHAMAGKGVNVARVDVFMFGVDQVVKGDWFLRNFIPGLEFGPRRLPMEPNLARQRINRKLANGDDEVGAPVPAVGQVGPVQDHPNLQGEADEEQERQQAVPPVEVPQVQAEGEDERQDEEEVQEAYNPSKYLSPAIQPTYTSPYDE